MCNVLKFYRMNIVIFIIIMSAYILLLTQKSIKFTDLTFNFLCVDSVSSPVIPCG